MRIDDDILRPKANNLTLARLVLATAVIYTHCFWLVTGKEIDDLHGLLGWPVSNYAVDGFFTLSGFLVYRSLQRTRSVRRFSAARLTRLWPALATMIVLTVIVGAFFTSASLGAYLTGGDTLRFVFANLSLAGTHYTVTGLNCTPDPCNLNGSLWTLTWEARCYVTLALIAAIGLIHQRTMLAIVLPATFAGAVLWHIPAIQALVPGFPDHGLWFNLNMFDRLWTAFALGLLAYEVRDRLPLSWVICLGLAAANTAVQWYLPVAGLHMRQLLIAYVVLCLGFLTARRGSLSGSWPDYSYGMYIYAYPAMLVAQAIGHFANPYPLAVLNFALTLPCAALSWHFVEKPALDWLRRRQPTAYTAPTGAVPGEHAAAESA